MDEVRQLFDDLITKYKNIKNENQELKTLLGASVYKEEKKSKELMKVEDACKIELVDAEIGMDIDSKILVPIKASDLSQNLLEILNLISISDMNKQESRTHIVGSYRWRAHKYPGDIDMMEVYKTPSTAEDVAIKMIKDELQKVANKINKNSHVKMADCKCGFDTRFDKLIENIGQLKRNYILPDMIAFFEKEIPGYDRNLAIQAIINLEKNGAINKETSDKLIKLLPPIKMTGNAYFELYIIIRKHRLLRWLISDLLNGYKVKPSFNDNPPYSIKLEEAIKHNTTTKIDLWAKIGTRWTEVTTFFVFQYGDKQPIGFRFDINLDESVKYDIMFYSSPAHEKNPKLAKRLWSRAINHLVKCIVDNKVNYDCIDPTQWYIIKRLYPVFSTDINKVSQLIGDIELMGAALDKRIDLNLSYTFIFKDLLISIEAIPQELFRILHLGIDANEMNIIAASVKEGINKILDLIKKTYNSDFRTLTDDEWDKLMTPENIEMIKQSLETIEKILKKKQDTYIKEYLIQYKLYPNVEGSIIRLDYTFNYLNLPKVTKI
jgi:hypothetical protein